MFVQFITTIAKLFSPIYSYDIRQRTEFAENYRKGKRNSRSGEGKETVL